MWSLCFRRWSLIAGHLPGRTDNEIKNYWNSHLSRRIDSFMRPSVDGAHMIMDLEMINRRCKRKGGRTSKSAMKKNTSNVQKSEEKQDTMEVLSGILDQNKERENVVLGPPHNRIFCPDEEMEGEERERGRLGTKQRLEDDFFCPDDGIEKGWVMSSIEERESGVTDGVLGSCEERESGITGGVFGSCEDRESGAAVRVLGYNEMIESGATGGGLGINEEIESGAMGANEEMGESDGWCSSMGHGFEEVGCLQNEWMDWDYLRMDDQTTDGGGETWPWLWGCDLSQDNF